MRIVCHIFFLYIVLELYFFLGLSLTLLSFPTISWLSTFKLPYQIPKNLINLSPSFISPIKTPSNLPPPITFHRNSKLKHFSLVMILKNLLMALIHAHQPLSLQIILLHPIRNTTLVCIRIN